MKGNASQVPSLPTGGRLGPSIAASSASGIKTNRVPMISMTVLFKVSVLMCNANMPRPSLTLAPTHVRQPIVFLYDK